MKWFERHLNWTAVIITVAGFILTVFLALYAMGFNGISRLYLISGEIKPMFLFTVLLSVLAMSTGMLWVIYRKQRSVLFTMFFSISLSIGPVLYLMLVNEERLPGYSMMLVGAITSVLAFVWLIGLIIILLLNNRWKDQKAASNKSWIIVTGVCLSIAFSLATVSCIRMETGHRNEYFYSRYLSEPDTVTLWQRVSFECPNSYIDSWESDGSPGYYAWFTDPGDNLNNFIYKRESIKPFHIVKSELHIHIFPDEIDQKSMRGASLTEKCVHLYFYDNDDIKADYDTYLVYDDEYAFGYIPSEKITIDAYEAESSVFPVSRRYTGDEYFVRMICFEKDDFIWTLFMIEEEETARNPDFDQVIESFRIGSGFFTDRVDGIAV